MTEQEHQIMQLAGKWWRKQGAWENAIRRETGLVPTRYFQILHRLIWRQDVEAEYLTIVHRLQRTARRATSRGHTLTLTLD